MIEQARQAQIELILTGAVYPETLNGYVDEVTRLTTQSYEHPEE